jgi:hypothetical protein
MSAHRNKWIEAVAKLIQLTQDRELVWTAQEPPLSFSKRPDFGVDLVFVCKYGERNLRLYEKYIRENVEESDEWEMRPVTRAEWKKRVVLEFVDANGNSLWAFPALEILNDLATAVQYRVAGVRDFLAELLAS